jgi:hypothetical protein
MLKRLLFILALTGGLCSSFFSCSKEVGKLELNCKNLNTAYSKDIVPILNARCMDAGCHSNSAYIGDYSSYEALKAKVDDGTFKIRVLDMKVMPPPATRPPLSEEEYMKFKCWYEAGAPNN